MEQSLTQNALEEDHKEILDNITNYVVTTSYAGKMNLVEPKCLELAGLSDQNEQRTFSYVGGGPGVGCTREIHSSQWEQFSGQILEMFKDLQKLGWS